eukprot:NODE_670_length_5356_cov_0.415066.p4 type:complete len:157 gc:universal NODE_670_length_5356_cov_0.415066:2631-3101(+)
MSDAVRQFRIHKTVFEMLKDRGYILSKAELDMTYEQFAEKYVVNNTANRSQLHLICAKRNKPEQQIYVVYAEEESVGVKNIRLYCEKMISNHIERGILIVQKQLTPSAKKIVAQMSPKYLLEVFLESELIVNITKHILVPQHNILEDKEKQSLLDR